jgi:hypothetical protein
MKILNNISTLDYIFSLYSVGVIYAISLLNTQLSYELVVMFCFLCLHLRYHQALFPFLMILIIYPNKIAMSLYLAAFAVFNLKNVYLTYPYPLIEILKYQIVLLPLLGFTQNLQSFFTLSLYAQLGLWSGLFLRCFPVSSTHWLQKKYLTSPKAIAIFVSWTILPKLVMLIILANLIFEPISTQSIDKKAVYFQTSLLIGFMIGFIPILQTHLILISFAIMLLKSLSTLLQDDIHNELHLRRVM